MKIQQTILQNGLTVVRKCAIIHTYTKQQGANMQDELQTQKQRLDTLMFKVQIVLDEMGLDEVDTVQDAFNALACAVDEVLSDSY